MDRSYVQHDKSDGLSRVLSPRSQILYHRKFSNSNTVELYDISKFIVSESVDSASWSLRRQAVITRSMDVVA